MNTLETPPPGCISTVLSHSTSSEANWLAHDPGRTELVNFPFAFTVFMILVVGLSVVCWAMGIPNGWLALVGTLVTLGGTFLYGWRLYDK